MLTKSKIEGMFFGIAIGDALGIPVESYTKERIEKEFGRIETYQPARNHKYMGNTTPGSWSDDTQLTLAVAESIIESNGLDLENQAKWHIKALDKTTAGWGKSTRFSVMNLKNGVSWPECSKLSFEGAGVGNGVPMKIAPIGALEAVKPNSNIAKLICEFSTLTHSTKISALAGMFHTAAIRDLLWNSTDRFNTQYFLDSLMVYFEDLYPLKYFQDLTNSEDDIMDAVLNRASYLHSDDSIIKEFNGGTCYVYNSLPFSYAFFLRNPYSIETLYDVTNAGGDTDTNASIVGGMLGALHGIEFFPKNLIETLDQKDYIQDVVNRFCDIIEVK